MISGNYFLKIMPKNPDINDNHPLATEIINLKNQGYSINYIVNHCATEGYQVTTAQIKKYLASKKEVKEETKEIKPKKKSGRQPLTINLEEFTNRFNIPDDLSNADAIMSNVQRLSAHTLMLQFGLLIEKLEAYQREEIDKYPYDQIRGLKLLNDVFVQLWGYEQAVNLSTAMKTLESQGYKIDAVNLLEQNTSKLGLEVLSEDEV